MHPDTLHLLTRSFVNRGLGFIEDTVGRIGGAPVDWEKRIDLDRVATGAVEDSVFAQVVEQIAGATAPPGVAEVLGGALGDTLSMPYNVAVSRGFVPQDDPGAARRIADAWVDRLARRRPPVPPAPTPPPPTWKETP